eukprot:12136475-Alexandrium_andersonii.AAC.1
MNTKRNGCDGLGSTSSMDLLTIEMASMVEQFAMKPYWVELTTGPRATWSLAAMTLQRSV